MEADELRLDYVIALEALLISPNDTGGRITANILSRAAALFLTRDQQEEAKDIVRRAYKARSIYVHGDVIKDQTEEEKLKELRNLRLLTLQVILRWLILTPSDTEDLAPLLDAAVQSTGRGNHISRPRAFFTTTPPRNRPTDVTAT